MAKYIVLAKKYWYVLAGLAVAAYFIITKKKSWKW